MKLIQMSNNVLTAVVVGARINLGVVDRKINGDCNAFTNTDTTISINQSGYYEVNVTANVVPTAAGVYTIQLYDGLTAIDTALASVTAAANDTYNLSFSKIIRVLPNCCSVTTNVPKVLSVVSGGVAANIDTINISVKKVG